MKQQIETLRKTRAFLLEMISSLSNEQLNAIPEGYSNNVIWNFAHLIAAQQGICYKRAGLPTIVEDSFFEAYKPGSRPEGTVKAEDVSRIKVLSESTIDRFEADYEQGKFASYPAWATRYGVTISSIEDAMQFVSYHEGLHTGYIMALRRMLALQPAL
jgi:hypothetical protein